MFSPEYFRQTSLLNGKEKLMGNLEVAALIGAAVTIAAFADAMGSYEALGNKLTEIDTLAGKL